MTMAVTPDELPVPPLVEWVLTWGLGARGFGKEEKRAWLVPFAYQGRRCSIGLYKFGLRLHVQASAEETPVVASNIIRAIDKAVRVAESEVLLEYAEGQVRAGNLTVKNQYHMFHNMYWDFRSQLEPSNSAGGEVQPADEARSLKDIVDRMNDNIRTDRGRFHVSVAMVNAYFSLLEHLLVLVWPLMGGYRPGVDDAEEMIASRWSDKFKTVFDISADRSAKHIYDRLHDVAEEFRNTYDHGGFDKRRGSLFVHFPGGAIPASLSKSRHRLRTNFFPVAEPEISDLLQVFGEVDEWLRVGPASFAMKFVEAGIDVPFNAAWLDELRQEMTTEEHFEGHLMGLARYLDDQYNMDW